MLVYKLIQLNCFDWSNDNVDLKMSDDWLLSTWMCMTSWKSYTHKYVQFKAKCQDIYVPECMIIDSDQTFSGQFIISPISSCLDEVQYFSKNIICR